MMDKIEWYREVLELEPSSKLFFPLARLLVEDGQPEAALETLRRGLERHPEFLEARLFYIEQLYHHGQPEACVAEVTELGQLFASYPGFWQAWAASMLGSGCGDVATALRFLAASFASRPLNLNEVFERGLRSFMQEAQSSDLPRGKALADLAVMGPEDMDYAVSFAVPLDAPGLFLIVGRQSCDTRKLENTEMDVGNAEFGGVEALTVFDNVFVPNDRIFLNGETEFTGMLVERFAGYHRQSYGGCKVGVGDVLIGAAAVAADYNGAAKASHIKDKLIEMTHLNETLYCCGIACSSEGHPTKSGNYMIDLLLANVCKQNVTRFPYEITRLAEDIAGGLVVTAPSEADLRDPKIGPYVDKYFKGVGTVSTENRLRILRLIENLCLGTAAVGYRTESMHGAGSPQAQRIMISRQGNLAHKKELAKKIAHISE